jgi:hypothetical protein
MNEGVDGEKEEKSTELFWSGVKGQTLINFG